MHTRAKHVWGGVEIISISFVLSESVTPKAKIKEKKKTRQKKTEDGFKNNGDDDRDSPQQWRW